jgi:hypothetical protein
MGLKMKLTKQRLKEIIKEELLKEGRDTLIKKQTVKAINYALDDLKHTLKKVRNPEKWAEKYHRGLPDVIEMIERITGVLSRMK